MFSKTCLFAVFVFFLVAAAANAQDQSDSSVPQEFRQQMLLIVDALKASGSLKDATLGTRLTKELFKLYSHLERAHAGENAHADIKKQVEAILKLVNEITQALATQKKSEVQGDNNLVIGKQTVTKGDNNCVFGNNTAVIGDCNQVVGTNNVNCGDGNCIAGDKCFVFGKEVSVMGCNTVAFGNDKNLKGSNMMLVDKYTIDLNKMRSGNKDYFTKA